MPPKSRLHAVVLCLTLLAFQTARAEDRSLVFLFGPTTEEHGRAAAHAAATVTKQWFQSPGAVAELRFTGNSDTQEFGKAMQIKDMESAFLYAAQNGRQGDLKGMVNGFDRAGNSLSHHPGKRLLIAILESPVLAGDAEDRLNATLAFCKENSINVVVLELSEPASKEPPPAVTSLATSTGGAIIRDINALETTVQTLFPTEKPAATTDTKTPGGSSGPQELSIHTRFIRIQSPKARAGGTEFAPMHGFLVDDLPLSALQFQTNGGNYLARARVTQVVRNAEGKAVWQAKKEITIKGPARKLEQRQTGNLSYMRELQLPGGQYTLEATVEDLIAEKTANGTGTLTASPTAPGFDVSDIVLVRPLDDSLDRFESDTTLSFNGKALVPMLDPPYRAEQPFDLQIYMVLYPDAQGGQPNLNLDILSEGQTVAHSQLLFNDKVQNAMSDGGSLDAKSGQKNEFPYLAKIPGTSLDAGKYEARVTVRQDKRTVTRSVAFQVR
jgi:hypothetical protein